MIPQRIEVIKKLSDEIKDRVTTLISYLSVLNTEMEDTKTNYEVLEAKTKVLLEKELSIDKKIGELKVTEEQAKTLSDDRIKLEEEKTMLGKERLMLNEKQKFLTTKEGKLNEKAQRLQTMLTE